jgi:hypothetical protein
MGQISNHFSAYRAKYGSGSRTRPVFAIINTPAAGIVMPLILSLILFLWTTAALAQSADTADVYAAWRDRVLQIQVIDLQADTKAGIGSGFFAGGSGWIVTNYHVIAELVNQPGRYKARYLAEGGQEGNLDLLSVDAVHDLALLRADDIQAPPLLLAGHGPPKGTRLYSMGYPYDIGLTIVEGTYNGMLEKSLYEKLHFTGSINPGMSGGPSLNQDGEVVGVNVATAGNQVSFLVPVHFVKTLMDHAPEHLPGEDDLNRQVARQLLENQQSVSTNLLNKAVPMTSLNGYSVPGGMASYLSCWGNSTDDKEDEIAQVYYRCQTQDDIFLSTSLHTGIIRYQHDMISTKTMHPLRFYNQLEKRGYYPRLQLDGNEGSVTNYYCQSDFIDQSGLPLKATFCVRSYRKLEGLYDAYLSITSLVESQEALQSTLVLAGFSWENVHLLLSRFMESFTWKEEDQ